MKALILLLLFLPSILFSAELWDEEDKKKHIAASALISGVSFTTARYGMKWNFWPSFWTSTGLTMLVGHVKESTDPFYDHRDMQANAIGMTAGLIIPLAFEF